MSTSLATTGNAWPYLRPGAPRACLTFWKRTGRQRHRPGPGLAWCGTWPRSPDCRQATASPPRLQLLLPRPAGEMLVGPVRALFADEISTGLDSNTTYQARLPCTQRLFSGLPCIWVCPLRAAWLPWTAPSGSLDLSRFLMSHLRRLIMAIARKAPHG